MDVVYKILVVLHFLGLASLIGGWLVQLRAVGERYVSAAMLHGVLTQLVTGVLLVGLGRGRRFSGPLVDRTKIGVKLVVTLGNHGVVLGQSPSSVHSERPLFPDRPAGRRERRRCRLLALTVGVTPPRVSGYERTQP